jgi:2-polyprenyl-3-methyl-5-hydroxy-6-metoxy-1,4-benzoquinol methylase
VLEIGCGEDQPLANVLHDSLGHYPKLMVAVDLNDIQARYNFGWLRVLGNFNFVKQWQSIRADKDCPHYGFDVVVCLEVIEHMQKKHGVKLLKAAREMLHKDGVFLLSTPVFSPKVGMAKNHIHEWGIAELQREIERAGLKVAHRFGTFMTANEGEEDQR